MEAEFRDGIINYIKADNTFNASIGGSAGTLGRFYWEFAEKDTEFPYCLATTLTFPKQVSDSCSKEAMPNIQFAIFTETDGAEDILSIAGKFISLMEDAESSITISEWKVRLVGEPIANPVAPTDDSYRQYVITILFTLDKDI